MGVVNVTPDSFSDGGAFLDAATAIAHGARLAAEGADDPRRRRRVDPARRRARSPAEEELRRVHAGGRGRSPAARARDLDRHVEGRRRRRGARRGRELVNDVTALPRRPRAGRLVADARRRLLPDAHARRAAHDAGRPALRRRRRRGQAFLEERLAFAVAQGIAEERILLDPGIGFGKTLEHNLELLRRLDELVALGRPLVIGTSRKGFLGSSPAATARRPRGRRRRSRPTCSRYERGATVFRVHDVARCADALSGGRCYLGGPMRLTSPRTTTTS